MTTARFKGFGIILLLAMLFATASASGADGTDLLTESEAIDLALKNSRELALLDMQVQAQNYRANALCEAVENPELRVRDLSSETFEGDEEQEFAVGLRWNLPQLGEIGLENQKNVVAEWENKVDLQSHRVELTTEVRLAFAGQIIFESMASGARRQNDLYKQRLDAIQQLMGLGSCSVLDEIKARRDSLEAHQEQTLIQRRYDNVRNRLFVLTKSDKRPDPAQCKPPVLSLDRNRLLEIARENKAEFALAHQKAELAQKRRRFENAQLVPWISFVEVDHHFERDKTDWQELRFGLTLPLFNWNGGKRRAATLAARRSDENREVVAEKLEVVLTKGVDDYEIALADWQLIQKENAEFLPRIARMIQAAKEDSVLPADKTIELELAEVQARMQQLKADYELITAAAELCRIVGVERWESLVETVEK